MTRWPRLATRLCLGLICTMVFTLSACGPPIPTGNCSQLTNLPQDFQQKVVTFKLVIPKSGIKLFGIVTSVSPGSQGTVAGGGFIIRQNGSHLSVNSNFFVTTCSNPAANTLTLEGTQISQFTVTLTTYFVPADTSGGTCDAPPPPRRGPRNHGKQQSVCSNPSS